MPNRRYQGKELPESEFISVDLLPDMRRPRQFNVNIILIVLVAVFFSWLLIYWPLSGRQEQLDSALETQNDLANLSQLLDQQLTEFRIDEDITYFSEQTAAMETLKIDYELLKTDLMQTMNQAESNTEFLYFSYDALTDQFLIRVSLPRQITFQNVRIALLELDYVEQANYGTPNQQAGSTHYSATFTIRIDADAF